MKMNLFELPPACGEEVTDVLWENGTLRVERIVSRGDVSPDGFWYDQDEDEWVSVLQGSAALEFPEGREELNPGDTVFLPAHRRHRVVFTSTEPPCIWLCVFGKKAQK